MTLGSVVSSSWLNSEPVAAECAGNGCATIGCGPEGSGVPAGVGSAVLVTGSPSCRAGSFANRADGPDTVRLSQNSHPRGSATHRAGRSRAGQPKGPEFVRRRLAKRLLLYALCDVFEQREGRSGGQSLGRSLGVSRRPRGHPRVPALAPADA